VDKGKMLSKRQQSILDFIAKEVREKGYPPSVREIGLAVGLKSSSTVHGHLAKLEKKGYIRRDPTKPRAIEIIHPLWQEEAGQTDVLYVPVVGKVTAGTPITAVENIESYVPLPNWWRRHGQSLFMLLVQGDSMIQAGILDGDYVVVRQQPTADNGDIVVALTDDGEATVKRFYKERDHIRLQPENPAMEPLRLSRVTILGKVVGLVRQFED